MNTKLSCPLCLNKKFIKTKQYDINELQEYWLKSYNFDPFPDDIKNQEYITKINCPECKIYYYSPSCMGDSYFYEKLSGIMSNYYAEEDRWEFGEAINILLSYRPKSLLEIGCGSGIFLEKVNYFIDYCEGIEVNQNAIDICRLKNLNVSSLEIQKHNRKYDVIALFEVLEHLSNIRDILGQIVDKLEDNGLLIIAVPNPDGYLKDCGIALLDLPPHHTLSLHKDTFNYIEEFFNLETIYYSLEPIRYVHYFSYLSSLYDLNSIHKNPLKKRIQLIIQSIVKKTFAPLFFPLVRSSLIGQTHFVVFKNTKLSKG